ncbi:MAG: bifunctional (p)ppGpp synthetase/guanosine-3',5'-bis(diphosphate) 3'-pyrophosphohydrolase [Peptoniphilaceae bacterium]|uniref:RelA/SpoT family protein n=1 Tax=Parvimonas sp. TaxID=1944660 RepID=UPI0025F314F2|nr:bifunctional (p)ppGpp synthetase/guanosine-3',5'-bis(diphosphate) 3'-pyrophosphohydrolase [Parvimonas sp.]MCI5997228.1 bifunctional (p)ppGpp synthetase/guanosine-3',5'-bis(diphosphate) 3'-pyrophosphohydrolase [Parvimonas sp.]MDD7764376.1 bifunctional (p)ppGpp synthetase/guanosine-3',5'-bis(diphosphate) 3'-pyrophosphohydrolase [Peptoniphilaceae bacterium]MDY3050038.1 bifunctional (p)ppGpp synthetase/guanosine-3',5'-bis(diphosphate) 3'-pyrophosphohydrolase [Parvimonas sp.]
MLDELLLKIKNYNPNLNSEKITKAYNFTKDCHEGQFRNSGEPYFIHPVAVANILADLYMDDSTIIAGLMHDILEDTDVTFEYMKNEFDEEIAKLVEGVTKLKKIKYQTKQESQADNLRKMVLAMNSDIRVIIIKIADRLHNMRTLEYMKKAKQLEKAKETLEIYAPLAYRLGMSSVKWELEDLSLRYLEPEIYYDLAEKVKKKRSEREKIIEDIISEISVSLNDNHIEAEISGRPKSLYSIYKKMYKQNKSFDEIFDLTAIRIIVPTISDCYATLGIVHSKWKPIPSRFKDYIAVPKPNLYQSLHNTLIGTNGEVFEVQIRTFDMHKTAEYGIAAHWKYKEGVDRSTDFDDKLTWLRQLMDWQRDVNDNREFITSFKEDFISDEVFVFSPKGDVINLVSGATPIDFAYKVHSAVGNNCVGAKVDGRIVPLNYKLKNGNIVEILTNPNSSGPSKDWLKIVKSSQARTKIKQWFKKENRSLNIVKGRDMLEKEVRRLGYTYNKILKEEWLLQIAKRMSFNAIDDMYAAIGFGTVHLKQVVPKLREYYNDYYKDETQEDLISNIKSEKSSSINTKGVVVKGIDNIEVSFAKCCNPLPGDEIIGYITKGRGISVHRSDCSNIKNIFNQDRLIEVDWTDTHNLHYKVEITVISLDQVGALADVAHVISESKLNLVGITAKTGKDKTFITNIIVEIKNIEELEKLINKVKAIKGILDVYRERS